MSADGAIRMWSPLKSAPANPFPIQLPGNTVQIAAAETVSYALLETGIIVGWSTNDFGSNLATPDIRIIAGLQNMVSIDATFERVVALRRDGIVFTWKTSGGKETQDSSGRIIIPVEGLRDIVQVATSSNHSLALDRNGQVFAWGFNGARQLGNNLPDLLQPVSKVSGLESVIAIDTGLSSSFALKSDGTLWAWGSNTSCMMGNGLRPGAESEPGGIQAVPTRIPGLTAVRTFSAGSGHVLALVNDGTVRSWGSNGFGQIGNGAAGYQVSPARVPGLNDVASIYASGMRSFAVTTGGAIWHWGATMPRQTGRDGQPRPLILVK